MKRGAGETGGEFPFEHLFAAAVPGGDPVPQIPYGLLAASIALRPEPGKPVPVSALVPEPLDIWRREIRELKAVPSGQIENRGVLGQTIGDDAVEAGLPGAGLVRGQFADIPLRDQTLGYGRVAVRGPDLAAFEPEATIGKPSFDEFGAGGHELRKCNDYYTLSVTGFSVKQSSEGTEGEREPFRSSTVVG
jgi:hypothetical protein